MDTTPWRPPCTRVLVPYKENVLDDVLTGSRESTREYIRAAFDARDATGLINVADVNARLSSLPPLA